MESQHFGHAHALAFNEKQSNQSEEASCSRCGEVVSSPSFSCVECGFYLHKNCAEAPSEINHPLHRKHPLVLFPNPPESEEYADGYICDFCDKIGKMFVYHCSCGLDFHIKCALFSCNIAEKFFGELEHIAHPWISTDEQNEELESAECFGCWNPLLESTYFSFDCGFNLHKKCVELSPEINNFSHQKHPLVLQFNGERFSCNMCQKPQRRGFVYCCSSCKFALHIKCAELLSEINHPCHRKHPLILQFNTENLPCKICLETSQKFVYCCSSCKFALHIECVSPPPTIKEESHQHPFILFWRPVSFICDACGLEGNYVAYICSTCSIIVHTKCIFLPRIIKAVLHHHPISHTYFLHQHECKSWDCRICHDNVNTEHGSYCCLDCKFIVHVNCIIKRERWYYIVETEKKDEKPLLLTDIAVDSITCVIERNEAGEATKVKHFSHDHDLVLSKIIIEDYKCCDGCMLSISTSFYSCSQCDFFLHKTCAELPRKTRLWYHLCQNVVTLIANNVYECEICAYVRSGFSYNCEK
ncbi:PREDICTED: uncharacterized protein LOC18603172 [Theobroma cacao]|uniref:Uncharacterized protein LOC18603172 n=1 Tax=Theobroma cacao TaxID=3641 RepID=A0AB32V9P9_THECC|nr:PREDICTED: uncharacterized protein LOC18603172 [Theobroma cacao]